VSVDHDRSSSGLKVKVMDQGQRLMYAYGRGNAVTRSI